MDCLGDLYYYGQGVTQSYPQAVTWYRKGADAGSAHAMANMGYMYENGYGVGKDLQQALAWYRKAAALGDPDAKASLKRLGESP